MSMAWHSQDDVPILTLSGRLDASAAPGIATWLEETVQGQPSNIVVDLGNVTFIDSTGLAILVKGMRRCRQQGGELVLCGLQQPVRVIFELTRLDQAFGIFSTDVEALASITGASHPLQ